MAKVLRLTHFASNFCQKCCARKLHDDVRDTAECMSACSPVEVATHKVMNDRSMLAQQMTIVVLKCELPEESFFHRQLRCGLPVEWQILRGDHLCPLILPKLHFVKRADPDNPADRNSWGAIFQKPSIYKSTAISLQQLDFAPCQTGQLI